MRNVGENCPKCQAVDIGGWFLLFVKKEKLRENRHPLPHAGHTAVHDLRAHRASIHGAQKEIERGKNRRPFGLRLHYVIVRRFSKVSNKLICISVLTGAFEKKIRSDNGKPGLGEIMNSFLLI